MILANNFEALFRGLGTKYFIENIQFVPDVVSWAKKHNTDLNEPHQLMKLVPSGNELTMVLQSEIPDEMLDEVITHLAVRWSLTDNMTDLSKKMNSIKKRLVFSFLKEYARSLKEIGGNEQLEDEWAMKAMDTLGFFRE
jgi:hypothetical protein